MKKDLIANPPSHELAAKLFRREAGNKPTPTTTLVKKAFGVVVADEKLYGEFVRYFKKGEVTGSIQADAYEAARLLVENAALAGQHELADLIKDRKIRLVDVVKRLSPVMRAYRFDVQRGVIVGVLGDVSTLTAIPDLNDKRSSNRAA